MTPQAAPVFPRRVLVLGAYGLIGAGLVQALRAEGHMVCGLGRDPASAHRVWPDLDWHIADMAQMTEAADWAPVLAGIDVVVNAAGALQDSGRDTLAAIHHHSVAALAEQAAAQGVGLVQISAAGVGLGADTEFMRSKARGDAAIVAAGGAHVILRPGLVLAPTGFGGSLLLRMLAAVPWVQPIALGRTPIQTIGLADLGRATCAAVAGQLPNGLICDLVEAAPTSLQSLTGAIRHWLGFAPARATIALPGPLLRLTGRGADLLGRLGWRSPLRTTAVAVLRHGVTGDPGPWNATGQPPIAPLAETLAAMPARSEDRVAARMALLMPLAVTVLALFWGLSGLIGLARLNTAATVLTGAGWPAVLAQAAVGFWALVDLAVAAAILYRPTARVACWGMVAVSLAYLAMASVVVPGLWADPLGPLVKVLPGIVLALVTRALLEER